jgi:hypothetical protein
MFMSHYATEVCKCPIKGQGNPKWTIGWNNDFTWKNFSMNIFFTGAFGVDRLNMSRYTLATAVGESRFISLRDAYYRGFDKVSNKAGCSVSKLHEHRE